MLTATSVIQHEPNDYGATSLVEGLFETIGQPIRLKYTPETQVECEHCRRIAFELVGECISILHRHDSQYHRSVIPLYKLGLKRIDQ